LEGREGEIGYLGVEMDKDRRNFIKKMAVAGVATVAAVSGSALMLRRLTEDAETSATTAEEPRKRTWIMVIDLDKCTGCRQCTVACQSGHFVPFDQEWIKIYDITDSAGQKIHFPRPCMNCKEAPCVKVCPVNATYHNEDDIVLIDHERCIGCRMCMAACPYEARYFNWTEPPVSQEEKGHKNTPEEPWPHKVGVVEKCMFCSPHRAEMGQLPYCVLACQEGSLYFGDLNEDAVSNGQETLTATELFKERQPYRFKEELGTKPKVYYLPRG
jgi:molybdopterin-containing oxidoreductase family iron-sulfur binding subunit